MSNPYLPDNCTQDMCDQSTTVTVTGRRLRNRDRRDMSTDAWCEYLNELERKKREGTAGAKELELLEKIISPVRDQAKKARQL